MLCFTKQKCAFKTQRVPGYSNLRSFKRFGMKYSVKRKALFITLKIRDKQNRLKLLVNLLISNFRLKLEGHPLLTPLLSQLNRGENSVLNVAKKHH